MKKKQTFSTPPVPYPYLKRLVALLIDWYASTFLAMLPAIVFQSINAKDLILLNQIDTLTPVQAVAATLLALGIYTLYFCVIPLRRHGSFRIGQTPGRRVFNLIVVKADRSPLTFKDLLIRDFAGVLLLQGNLTSVNTYLMVLVILFTGYQDFVPYLQWAYSLLVALSLVMLLTKRKQTLEDLISSTRMIEAKQETENCSQGVSYSPSSQNS